MRVPSGEIVAPARSGGLKKSSTERVGDRFRVCVVSVTGSFLGVLSLSDSPTVSLSDRCVKCDRVDRPGERPDWNLFQAVR